jgi:hypothetical protein
MRDDVEAESPEEYFRKSITVTFLTWHIWTITMDTTKSKLQMEFNKVTSASSGLVYVCFGRFVKCSRVWAIAK